MLTIGTERTKSEKNRRTPEEHKKRVFFPIVCVQIVKKYGRKWSIDNLHRVLFDLFCGEKADQTIIWILNRINVNSPSTIVSTEE